MRYCTRKRQIFSATAGITALAGRAFLFFAYPKNISGDVVWVATNNDAFSGATPLSQWAAGLGDNQLMNTATNQPLSWMDCFLGNMPGAIGEVFCSRFQNSNPS